ncbi:hypothetical protein LUZ62_041797 [Rhynchospora pubera]|uniref:Uncharacterized protein n=1 Tax=Rhynchospora pubera TaxID=906938 RepID=A0AAV8FGD7_9POAL|nr:hypothetical protein LUZ62_041797 [Rhynchospora pubera]
MEATALSLAQTVVGGVLQKSSSAAVDEVAKVLGVRQDIWYIRDELEMMQAFLVAAEAQQDKNNVMLIWVRQVKRLAYQIEDCLAEFSLHLENRSLYYRLRTLSTRRQIASKIRDIRVKVEETSKRNLRYNLVDPLKSSSDATSSNGNFAVRMDALVVEETELVNQIEPKNELLSLITESNKNRKVIWVTGMGGLGKTTLVKKVFDSSKLSNKFSYRVWFTVSQTFILKDLLTEILLDKEGKFRNENEDKLIERVRSKLEEHAYFVVLDDLWTNQAWDIIEKVFPNNEEGSRVMVATRNVEVAKHCNWKFKDSYAVQFLSDERSRELLLRKIYKSDEVPDSHKDLNSVTEKIIKKCGGLPLAIVTIGGLLASKPINKEEWEKLVDRLGSELETNPTAEATKQILELSYHDLPYYLKPCLLYLSIFPEDFEIKCSRLVYLWMAEGFVRERRGMTPEEVAEEYLSELINRNLIQPWTIRFDGTIKSCRVHDIMRELLVAKSIEENLIFITGEQKNITLVDNIRHLVITRSNDVRRINLQSIRSVSVFDTHVPSHLSSPYDLKLLRVLDLRSVEMVAIGLNSLKSFEKASRLWGQFEHLRYNSMPPNYWGVIPKSFGNLRGLQTLDARRFGDRQWSINVTKLQNLRRLFTSTDVGHGNFARWIHGNYCCKLSFTNHCV